MSTTAGAIKVRQLNPNRNNPFSPIASPKGSSRSNDAVDSEESKEQITISINKQSLPLALATQSQQSKLLASLSPRSRSGPLSSRPWSPVAPCQLHVPHSIRVRAVIEATLTRLSLVHLLLTESQSQSQSALTSHTAPIAVNAANKIIAIPDLNFLFVRHSLFQSHYDQLQAYRATLHGLSNKSKFEACSQSLMKLSHSLTEIDTSIKNNLLLLKPENGMEMKKKRKDLEFVLELFQLLLQSLSKRHGSFRDFHTLIHEEESKINNYNNKKTNALLLQEKLQSLQSALKGEEAQFATRSQQLAAELALLGDALKNYKNQMTNSLNFEHQSQGAKFETQNCQRLDKLNSLKKEIMELKYQLKLNSRVNKFNTNYLNYSKNEVEQSLDEWKNNYQFKHATEKTSYAELTQQRGANQRVLVALQTSWESEQQAKCTELHERKAMKEEHEQQKRETETRELAARKIQFAFRVYWRRRKVALKKLHKAFLKKQKAAQK